MKITVEVMFTFEVTEANFLSDLKDALEYCVDLQSIDQEANAREWVKPELTALNLCGQRFEFPQDAVQKVSGAGNPGQAG